MRVLGSDAVQNPTKVEAHVRSQMAKRQKLVVWKEVVKGDRGGGRGVCIKNQERKRIVFIYKM